MRKLLSMILCTTMLLSLCVPAMAATVTTETSQDTTVTYGVSESYVVSVPDAVVLDEDGIGECTVCATNVLLNTGNTLNVSIYSENANGKIFNMKNTENASVMVNYTIYDAMGTTIANNDTIISVASGNVTGATTELALSIQATPILAGEYKDTITFVVEVKEAADMISFTLNGSSHETESGMTMQETNEQGILGTTYSVVTYEGVQTLTRNFNGLTWYLVLNNAIVDVTQPIVPQGDYDWWAPDAP